MIKEHDIFYFFKIICCYFKGDPLYDNILLYDVKVNQ